jgi:hypothetical protein
LLYIFPDNESNKEIKEKSKKEKYSAGYCIAGFLSPVAGFRCRTALSGLHYGGISLWH